MIQDKTVSYTSGSIANNGKFLNYRTDLNRENHEPFLQLEVQGKFITLDERRVGLLKEKFPKVRKQLITPAQIALAGLETEEIDAPIPQQEENYCYVKKEYKNTEIVYTIGYANTCTKSGKPAYLRYVTLDSTAAGALMKKIPNEILPALKGITDTTVAKEGLTTVIPEVPRETDDNNNISTRAMAKSSLNNLWGKVKSCPFQQNAVLLAAATEISIAAMKGAVISEKDAAAVAFNGSLRLRNNGNFVGKYFGLLGTKYEKQAKRIKFETATKFLKSEDLESLLEEEIRKKAKRTALENAVIENGDNEDVNVVFDDGQQDDDDDDDTLILAPRRKKGKFQIEDDKDDDDEACPSTYQQSQVVTE